MASTRRSPPADGDGDPVAAAARRCLAALAGRRLGIALSGGRDSSALLHALARGAPRHGVPLHAVHVHHGLSPHAGAWGDLCIQLAAQAGVPLDVKQVVVADATVRGVEAAARAARYDALRAAASAHALDAIALAHHEDDQAETLLLQALRGAGPHGLAGMAARRDEGAIAWLRPLLAVPRSAVDAYVAAHGLRFVDDESNASARHRRNALRLDVMPPLLDAFPAASRTLARAAALQAEAAGLLDELAALDARDAMREGMLSCRVLGALPPPRARNLLRWFLRDHGAPAPSAARLDAMFAQLAAPRPDARTRLHHAGLELGVHRGHVTVHAPPPVRYEVRWQGERELALPHGRLGFVPARGEGVDAGRLEGRVFTVAPRRGGERFTPDIRRPRRALGAWLYDSSLPAWERDALPLVFCDGQLVAVPGVGVDVAFQASPGAPGWTLRWQPHPSARVARR